MKRHEKGQGLVEYALILVLVAVVVLAVLLILGPIIGGVFCEVNAGLEDLEYYPSQSVTMGINDNLVTIDTKEGFASCVSYVSFGEVVTNASHGFVEHQGEGIFTYEPNNVGSEIDDSFTYSYNFSGNPNDPNTGLVTIIVGEPDLAVSQSNILSTAEDTTRKKKPKSEFTEVEVAIFALVEEAEEQEGNFQEGADLAVEAVVEGLEVLIDFADDNEDPLLSASLSQLLGEVKDGNLDAVPEAIAQMGTDLAETPVEVWLAMSLKMAPRLIKSCVVVSEASVSPDTIAAVVQAVEGLDEDHPGKAEALLLLQDGVATIEARNNATEEYAVFQSVVLEIIVDGFVLAGEEELAAQLAADSEACGN